MSKLMVPAIGDPDKRKPDKIETWAGKYTARVSRSFNQPDGSVIKQTRRFNKDGSITDKVEVRHQ